MKPDLNKKNIIKGIRFFLILTVIGIVVIFFSTGSRETWNAVKQFRIQYFFLACLLIFVDLCSGACRIHIFVRKLIPHKSFSLSFRANLANIFLGAATPFGTGGGLAQLFMLNQGGVSYSAGFAVGVINFIATITLLFVSGTIILTSLARNFFESQSLMIIINTSRAFFYIILILFLLFLCRPTIFGRLVEIISRSASYIFQTKQKKFQTWSQKIIDFTYNCHTYIRFYWKNEKIIFLLNYIITIILYFNKCLVAYIIFLGLHIRPNFWYVIMLQMVIIFFLYFTPTPGASFVAETSTAALMSLIAPQHLLSLFTVLWRFFTTYFGVMLGSAVILKAISRSRGIIHS